MSRETTPTKQWADELEQPRTSSPNDTTTTPKISAGWKRQLLLHAERSKKQAEKEVEKQKKIEEWRSEEKKKVLDAKASPDRASPAPVHSPFHAEQRGRGSSPIARTSDHAPRTREPRSDTQRPDNNARYEQRHNNNRQYEHKPRGQHSERSPSDKYAPSHRPEVESERWSRGGHVPGHRGRGSRGRGRDTEWRNTRHSPARDHEEEHVDVVSRSEASTRANAPTRARVHNKGEAPQPLLVVNVELENGAQTQLVIHEQDELARVARDFCKEHVIDRQLVDLFVEEIAIHLKQVAL